MQCPRGHDNPAGSRFCLECGQALTLACEACGTALPASAKFCNACGAPVGGPRPAAPPASPESYTPRHLAERILTSRGALEGERKPVTVLFCDVVGSTALAERLGPDAMHGLLNTFFELALAEIHRYEGTVNQFLGDGFMALFGAPLAHEDHARRAALAALGVARAVGERPLVVEGGVEVSLTVRMGLHTGLVVVGAIGDNLRMDYTAVGDTTHLAARLQQAAPPGAMLLSDATARLVEGHVALERVGELELRGHSGRVMAYRLAGGAPAAGRRAPRSPFVGREREMTTLQALFGEVERGQGRIAGIVAEPGLGKSRLLAEFRDALGDRALCLEGRCLSYGAAIPYLPIVDLVRGFCGIADVDPPERIVDKVGATLESLGIERARATYLLQLLGIKMDERGSAESPDVLAARTHDTLRNAWLRSSRQRPLVLLLEDLHWIDGASEACLGSVADALGGAAVLLAATYRPGHRPSWIDRSYATQISLAPLPREASLSVVRSMRPEMTEGDARARLILDKGEGNPFFLEELVHAVTDGDGERLAVPDSVQGVLAARIDRLPASAKQTLQVASVLGRQFPERVLRAVADAPERLDDDLRELTRQEFLHERAEGEERGYVFKHALTQEVAYESLVVSRRRALHRAAAAGLARLEPERLDELTPLLAHHYLAAEAWADAVAPARRAAETARRAGANSEALTRYDDALRAAERAGLPAAERRALLEERGGVQAGLGRFEPARADLEMALALAEGDGDAVAQARVLAALGALWGGHRDYARGIELTRRALELAGPTGDRRALAETRVQLGVMLLNLARMLESRRELQAAMALFEAAGDGLGAARAQEVLAMNLQLSGDADAAIAELDRALMLLREAGDRRTEIPALVSLGAAFAWTRGFDEGIVCLRRGLHLAESLEARSDEAFMRAAIADFGMGFGQYTVGHREASAALVIARELGHREWTAYALGALGRVHAECGLVDEARRLHDEELVITRQLGGAIWIADALGNLGHDLLAAGELDAAAHWLEQAVAAAAECAQKAIFPLLDLGDIALARGAASAALDAVARGRAAAPGYRILLHDAARIEAAAWALQGRHAEAERLLRDVIRAAERYRLQPTRWRAGVALAEVLAARGRPAEARQEAAVVASALEAFARELSPATLAQSFLERPLLARARTLAGGG
jgi:class 3 adenylate cyclase/tetratricopeptide (TPR) repeat protein